MDVKSLILVGLASYFAVVMRNIPTSIFRVISYMMSWEVMSTSAQSSNYKSISNWIMDNTKSKAVMRRSKLSEEWDNNTKVSVRVLGLGTFYEWTNGTLLIYRHHKEETKGFEPQYEIRVVMMGRCASEKYSKLISRLMDSTPHGKIRIVDGYDDKLVDSRSIDTVFSKSKDYIVDSIDKWLGSREMYTKFGKTHKLGMLLYGPPGTGKTSMARALATKYKRDIVILDPQKISSSSVSAICTNIPSGSMVLIEEIDTIVAQRDLIIKEDVSAEPGELPSEKPKDNDNKFNDPIYKLLNVLDGVMSPSDVIFVATTNHIDKIDPALLRVGRFDIKIHMGLFDEEDVIGMCIDNNIDPIRCKDMTYPATPCEVQNKLMEMAYNDEYSKKM